MGSERSQERSWEPYIWTLAFALTETVAGEGSEHGRNLTWLRFSQGPPTCVWGTDWGLQSRNGESREKAPAMVQVGEGGQDQGGGSGQGEKRSDSACIWRPEEKKKAE